MFPPLSFLTTLEAPLASYTLAHLNSLELLIMTNSLMNPCLCDASDPDYPSGLHWEQHDTQLLALSSRKVIHLSCVHPEHPEFTSITLCCHCPACNLSPVDSELSETKDHVLFITSLESNSSALHRLLSWHLISTSGFNEGVGLT